MSDGWLCDEIKKLFYVIGLSIIANSIRNNVLTHNEQYGCSWCCCLDLFLFFGYTLAR